MTDLLLRSLISASVARRSKEQLAAKVVPKVNKKSADLTFYVPFLRPILSYKLQVVDACLIKQRFR